MTGLSWGVRWDHLKRGYSYAPLERFIWGSHASLILRLSLHSGSNPLSPLLRVSSLMGSLEAFWVKSGIHLCKRGMRGDLSPVNRWKGDGMPPFRFLWAWSSIGSNEWLWHIFNMSVFQRRACITISLPLEVFCGKWFTSRRYSPLVKWTSRPRVWVGWNHWWNIDTEATQMQILD